MATLLDTVKAKAKIADAIKADVDSAKIVAKTKTDKLAIIKGIIRADVISKTKAAVK